MAVAGVDVGSSRIKGLLVDDHRIVPFELPRRHRGRSIDRVVAEVFDFLKNASSLIGSNCDVEAVSLATSWPTVLCFDAKGFVVDYYEYDDPRCVLSGSRTYGTGELACSFPARIEFTRSRRRPVADALTLTAYLNQHLGARPDIDSWTASLAGGDYLAELLLANGRETPTFAEPWKSVGSVRASDLGAFRGATVAAGSGDSLVAAFASSSVFQTQYHLELGSSALLLDYRSSVYAPRLVQAWPQFGLEVQRLVCGTDGADGSTIFAQYTASDVDEDAIRDRLINYTVPTIDGVVRLDLGKIEPSQAFLNLTPVGRLSACIAFIVRDAVGALDNYDMLAFGGRLSGTKIFGRTLTAMGLRPRNRLASATVLGSALIGARTVGASSLVERMLEFGCDAIK